MILENAAGTNGYPRRKNHAEQHSDRLQADELCFARLIGLLLGDPGQRPMHRVPSTAGGCNAEASRR
jgi:hypothetical protein